MKTLSAAFEDAGMKSVRTYINSGNVIFSSSIRSKRQLSTLLENAILETFALEIPVLIRDIKAIRAVVEALPASWVNDKTTKCDVMFLWEDIDRPSIVRDLKIKPGLDDVRYESGALIWRVDGDKVTRSGLMKLAGTPLYTRMTIRNCNTARKLLELMEA